MNRICCAALLLAASHSPAFAVWTMKATRNGSVAIGTAAQGSWSIRMSCIRGERLDVTFILRPRGDFDGARPVVLKIDGVATPVTSDGAGEYGLIVHDTPALTGMSKAFLARSMEGHVLVLDGPASARVRIAQRTFPLDGAAAALRAVAFQCPSLE